MVKKKKSDAMMEVGLLIGVTVAAALAVVFALCLSRRRPTKSTQNISKADKSKISRKRPAMGLEYYLRLITSGSARVRHTFVPSGTYF